MVQIYIIKADTKEMACVCMLLLVNQDFSFHVYIKLSLFTRSRKQTNKTKNDLGFAKEKTNSGSVGANKILLKLLPPKSSFDL